MTENSKSSGAAELDDANLGKVSGGWDYRVQLDSIEEYQSLPKRIGRSAPCPICGRDIENLYGWEHRSAGTQFGEVTECIRKGGYFAQL